VFEQLADARGAITQLAERNGIRDRLDILGSCAPEALEECLTRTKATLILCDVEGYERELLDLERVPSLRGVDMLIEVHDAQVPGVSQVLTARFGSTHDIAHIRQGDRSVRHHYPFHDVASKLWPGAVLKYGLNEFRSPENGWLWLKARH